LRIRQEREGAMDVIPIFPAPLFGDTEIIFILEFLKIMII